MKPPNSDPVTRLLKPAIIFFIPRMSSVLLLFFASSILHAQTSNLNSVSSTVNNSYTKEAPAGAALDEFALLDTVFVEVYDYEFSGNYFYDSFSVIGERKRNPERDLTIMNDSEYFFNVIENNIEFEKKQEEK